MSTLRRRSGWRVLLCLALLIGRAAQHPEHMLRWLQNPPAVDPLTAMPNLGITEAEARDIAGYLYTLRRPTLCFLPPTSCSLSLLK